MFRNKMPEIVEYNSLCLWSVHFPSSLTLVVVVLANCQLSASVPSCLRAFSERKLPLPGKPEVIDN